MPKTILLIVTCVVPLHAAIFGSATTSVPFTWYVDSVSGSDSNNGTSENTPFLTLSKVQSVVQANQSIGLKAGGSWREQLVIPSTGITVGKYGYGALPLVDASDLISSGDWSKTGGQTLVYQVLEPISGDVTSFVRVWENDIVLVRATSIANCDSTAGSYFPSSDVTTPITIYVHASDGSNPALNGKTYEYSRRPNSIGSAFDNTTVRSIHARRNLQNNGSIVLGKKHSVISNCLAEDGSKHNILIGTGGVVMVTEARNFYYAGQGSIMFVYNADTPTQEGLTFLNDRATVPASAGVATDMVGFSGHPNVSGTFGVVEYRNSYAEKCNPCFSTGSADLAIYTGLIIDTAKVGIATQGASQISGVTMTNMSDIGVTAAGDTDAVTITASSIASDGGSPRYAVYSTTNNTNISITYSSSNMSVGAFMSGTGCSFTSLHNSIFFYVTYGTSQFLSDYNTFTGAAGSMTINLVNYGMFSSYQAATGQDLHSTQ